MTWQEDSRISKKTPHIVIFYIIFQIPGTTFKFIGFNRNSIIFSFYKINKKLIHQRNSPQAIVFKHYYSKNDFINIYYSFVFWKFFGRACAHPWLKQWDFTFLKAQTNLKQSMRCKDGFSKHFIENEWFWMSFLISIHDFFRLVLTHKRCNLEKNR